MSGYGLYCEYTRKKKRKKRNIKEKVQNNTLVVQVQIG